MTTTPTPEACRADQQARLRALVGLLGQEIERTFKDAEHAARYLEPRPMKVLEGV